MICTRFFGTLLWTFLAPPIIDFFAAGVVGEVAMDRPLLAVRCSGCFSRRPLLTSSWSRQVRGRNRASSPPTPCCARYGGDTTADAPEEYALLAVIAGSKGARSSSAGPTPASRYASAKSCRRVTAQSQSAGGQITIERAGVRSVVKLPQKNTSELLTGVAPPPGKSLPTIKMTRGQMAGVIEAAARFLGQGTVVLRRRCDPGRQRR